LNEAIVSDPAEAGDPLAAVAACRAGGGAERDPVRFHVIEALARRAAAQQGLARQVLSQRVDQLVLQLMQQEAQPPGAAGVGPAAPSAGLLALGALVDRLGRTPGSTAAAAAVPAPRGSAASASRLRTAPPPLKAVASHPATWQRLRAQQRLRQALAQVPAKAGPLNSSHVVHRALQTLHGLSPAYLDAFMAHVDTLLWLEQSSGAAELPARPAPRAAAKPATKAAAKPTRRR
jgi:Protein of unknown function (DUF2894)